MKEERYPEGRINVVDSKNINRVLGTIPLPHPDGPKGRRVAMAVCTGGYASIDLDYVMLEHTEQEDNGWTHVCVKTFALSTSTPLSVLLTLSSFRLPNESDYAARKRRVFSSMYGY